jgi:hypothetical protein
MIDKHDIVSVFFHFFNFQYLNPPLLVARNWSGSYMRLVGRALSTPGLDVKADESSGQLPTSRRYRCIDMQWGIHTINCEPPAATGLCPLASPFITSIHYEQIYFYQCRHRVNTPGVVTGWTSPVSSQGEHPQRLMVDAMDTLFHVESLVIETARWERVQITSYEKPFWRVSSVIVPTF